MRADLLAGPHARHFRALIEHGGCSGLRLPSIHTRNPMNDTHIAHRGKFVDLTGQRFQRLVVTARAPKGNSAGARWHVRCDCGTEKTVYGNNLRSGQVVSCGCYRAQLAGLMSHARKWAVLVRHTNPFHPTRHGHTGSADGKRRTPTYYTWQKMRERCNDPKHIAFRYYGARGIKVCDRWQTSFDAFLSDVGDRPEGRTLDRINPDGNYEPGNVRWATAKEQQANRRRKSRSVSASRGARYSD